MVQALPDCLSATLVSNYTINIIIIRFIIKMKRILFFLFVVALFVACADDDSFSASSGLRLDFPSDTVKLDTVFSRTSSSTYSFWVHNRNDDGVRLKSVYLKKGNQTGFRVNVNGTYIGSDAVLTLHNVPDQKVTVGIRPEGFIPQEDGPLKCKASNVEVMGRDVSIVSTHDASMNPLVRSIINADNKVDITSDFVRYSIKPHKIFIFNKETEERIYFEVK